ncbi:MAG: hypothetical protein EA385_02005 [Salinarimonadaceae bacterium]|nr:MAG: hypothetical protein EA385_02005 [Salinarimonadaceae bacterium]
MGPRTRAAIGRFLEAEGIDILGLDDRALLSQAENAVRSTVVTARQGPPGTAAETQVGLLQAGDVPPLTVGPAAADLRMLDFDHVDGVPILNARERGIGLPALAMLVRLGQTHDLLERRGRYRNWQQDPARLLAVALLEDPARSRFLRHQNFAGRTEIERDVLRAEFIEFYGDALRAMAPQLPFRAAVVARDTELYQYDTERGGFEIRGGLGNRGLPFGKMLSEAPDLVWRMSEDEARSVLADLRASRSGMSGRSVSAVVHVEVLDIAPDTGAWVYRRLHTDIYDADRRRRLGVLPAPRPLGAGAELAVASADPERLLTPPPGILPLNARYADGVLQFDRWHNGMERLFTYLRLRSDPAPFADSFGDRFPVRAQHPVGRIMTDEARALYFARGRFGALEHHGPDAAFSGRDEFERAGMRERFEREIVEPFLAWAPTPGVRFGFSRLAELGPYDSERGGLPLQQGQAIRLDWRAIHSLEDENVEWLNGHAEEVVLPLGMDEARAFLAEMRAAAASIPRARQDQLDAIGSMIVGQERFVELRFVAEVATVDPETGTATLRLVSARVLDVTGARLLTEIPVTPAGALPMVLADLPEALHVAHPPPLESVTTVRLLLLREGVLGEAEFDSLGRDIVRRDQRLHADPPDMSDWHAFDARRPFWRASGPARGDLNRNAPTRDRFQRWAAAYAEGLGERVLSRTELREVGVDRVEVVPLADFHWLRRDAGELATRLEVWPDQILAYPGSSPDLALVTPYRGVAATVAAPREEFGALDPSVVSLRTEFEIEHFATVDLAGSMIPVLRLRPVALWVLPPEAAETAELGVPLAVIPLGTEAQAAEGVGDGPVATPEPLPLDRHLADLLLLRLGDIDLPDEILVHLAFRRLAHERATPFPYGGRFFPAGAEERDPEALLAMGRDFAAWARALDWAPPPQVTLEWRHAHVRAGERTVSDSSGRRYPTTLISNSRASGFRNVAQCQSSGFAEASAEVCEAAVLNNQFRPLIYVDPDRTRGADRFRFGDPLTVVHRHLTPVIAPPVPPLSGNRLQVHGKLVFDLEDVRLDASVPLTDGFLGELALAPDHRWAPVFDDTRHQRFRGQNPALVLDLRFRNALWEPVGAPDRQLESQRNPTLDVEAQVAAARARLAAVRLPAPAPEPSPEAQTEAQTEASIQAPESAVAPQAEGMGFDLQRWLAEQAGEGEPLASSQPSPRPLANDILGVAVGQDLPAAERHAIEQLDPALTAAVSDAPFGGARILISNDERRAMALHYLAGIEDAEPVIVGVNLLTLFPAPPPLDRLRQTLVARFGEAVAELGDGPGRFGLAERFDPSGHCAAFTTADANAVAWDDLHWTATTGAVDYPVPGLSDLILDALLLRPVHAATEAENLELGEMLDCGLTLHAALIEGGGRHGFLVSLYDFPASFDMLAALSEQAAADDDFVFSLDPD